jgi:hypothetical protein
MFEDVTLLGNTFLKNNEYMSCYDVLEAIMKRFNMSCFQSLNSWWIVRYPDLFLDYQQGETLVDYYRYEETTFAYLDKFTINKSFVIDSSNKVETGLLKSIIRPYRRTLETFKYIQPEQLICNSNFDDLGPLINTYIVGSNTIRNYQVPCWEPLFDGNIFIRQELNSFGEQIDRYLGTDTFSSAGSNPIELAQNDTFDISFQVRTNNSISGYFQMLFYQAITITDGTTLWYMKNDGSWTIVDAYDNLTYEIQVGDNTNQWHTVSFKSQKIPVNGILSIKLVPASLITGTGLEFYYKDLTLTVAWIVGGQLLVNGHSHTASQSKKLNNVNDVEITIDNSERSSISGTLFLTSQTGLLQDKCTTWKFGEGYNTGIPSQIYNNLGQLITQTYMYQRYKPRTKFNGNLLSIRNANGILSNLAIFSNEFIGDLQHNKMLLGSLAIDYKNDSAEFTMWEVFNSEIGYVDNFTDYTNYLFNILYQFNYLYENN